MVRLSVRKKALDIPFLNQNAGDRRVPRNDGEDDEAGGPWKGCGEIRRKTRCNLWIVGILNLQIRAAPDCLREQIFRCADIDFRAAIRRPPAGFRTKTFKCFRTDFRTDGIQRVYLRHCFYWRDGFI
jgi:hypothetical protein